MKNLILVFFIILSTILPVYGQADASKKEPVTPIASKQMVPGFIFNMSSLVSSIDDYQAGIGFKLKRLFTIDDTVFNLRGVVDLDVNEFIDDFGIKAGVALECPFINDKQISPYWGVFANVGFHYIYEELTETTWTRQIDLPISAGFNLGVEVFVFDFLSFFVEYSLSFNFSNSFLGSSASTDQTITTMQLITDLGNSGMIGIVIYFNPVVRLRK